jgi:Fe(3+) dicitrate transport protein
VVDDGPNDGEISSLGLELQIGYDFGAVNSSDFSLPVTFGLTLTDAKFESGASSADGESIFSGAQSGNAVPYIPVVQFHAGIGLEVGKYRVALDGTCVGKSHASGANGVGTFDNAGNYDSRYGEVPSYFTADLTVQYQISDSTKVFATARNLFDAEYIVGRLPQGARPGMPQSFLVGIEAQF